jgi:hypothetical protein
MEHLRLQIVGCRELQGLSLLLSYLELMALKGLKMELSFTKQD